MIDQEEKPPGHFRFTCAHLVFINTDEASAGFYVSGRQRFLLLEAERRGAVKGDCFPKKRVYLTGW